MDAVRSVTEEMTCEHGDPARAVCGCCGTPVCSRGSDEVRDVSLSTYESGWRPLGIVVALVVGVPVVFTQVFPGLLGSITNAIFREAMYLRIGLVRGSILLGLLLLPALRVRNGESVQLLVRRVGTRTVCDDCRGTLQRQRAIQLAIALVGAIVALYGVYRMYDYGRLLDLWYVGLGAGLVVARTELTQLAERLLD